MRVFDFSTARQADTVVVIGGGPTAGRRLPDARKFAEERGALVYSANYEHDDLPSDYICFATPSKFKECLNKKPNCKDLVVRDKVAPKTKRYPGYNYYQFCSQDASDGAYSIKSIPLTKYGHFPLYNIGNAGFSTIALACLSRPKDMLLVGFDGLRDESSKLTYENKVMAYPAKKGADKKIYFGKVILQFALDRGIRLHAFEDDALWGWQSKANIIA